MRGLRRGEVTRMGIGNSAGSRASKGRSDGLCKALDGDEEALV